MSILIKGMEMPKSCRKCMISQPDGCGWICPIIESKPIVDGRVNSRHPHCPLVPVPPHGDLIDYDFCMKNYELLHDDDGNPVYAVRMRDINIAPTIIPAEGQGYILAPQEEYDGLKRKYVVLKSDTGEFVENCFVLRPDKDKAAIAALLAYADATDNQVLAKDIRAWISTIPAEEATKV